MPTSPAPFRAGLRFHGLTRYYDTIVHGTLRDRALKERLIASAQIAARERVLDFGCGTGSLTLMAWCSQPGAEFVGLDVDPSMIAQCRRRSMREEAPIDWRTGRLDLLLDRHERFDVAVSSLVFHHLTTAEKREAFRGLYELLFPGGRLLVADFGRGTSWLQRAAFVLVRLFDGFDRTEAHARGELPGMMEEAGFTGVTNVGKYGTIFGLIQIWQASRSQ